MENTHNILGLGSLQSVNSSPAQAGRSCPHVHRDHTRQNAFIRSSWYIYAHHPSRQLLDFVETCFCEVASLVGVESGTKDELEEVGE
jgi:hypothetical protein